MKGRKPIPSISWERRFALNYLFNQYEFIIAIADKNHGKCIIHQFKCIQIVFKDYLNNTLTYKRLSKQEEKNYIENNTEQLAEWPNNSREELNKQEVSYLEPPFKVDDLMPYFYLTMKVNKTPLKSRTIVSFPGSLFYGLGV